MRGKWKAGIISESLEEPSILNEYDVYQARISKREELIDEHGSKGRWHLYWVDATDKQTEALSREIKKGWYAHFWNGQTLLAVFQRKGFEFHAEDKSTWKEAIEYGKSVGIPEEQLDFPTE